MSTTTSIEWTDATWHMKTAAKRIGVSLEEYRSRVVLGQKWCTGCRAWHSRSVFPRDRSRGDGLRSKCGRTIKPRPKTPEQRRETARTGYRRYYAGIGGPAIRARVYARKRATEPVSPLDRELVFEKFDGRCAYCGNPATSIDHVVSVKRGGDSRRGNLLPACTTCNSRKNAGDFDAFLETCLSPSDLIAEELAMAEVL